MCIRDRHMDVAAEGTIELFEKRREIPGLRFVFEPEVLRFFQARFETIPLEESARELEKENAAVRQASGRI